MATTTRDVWERTFDRLHHALEQAAERGGTLHRIELTFRSGAVISLTPDPSPRESEIKAALEQLREELLDDD